MPAGLPLLPLHVQPWALVDELSVAFEQEIESQLDRMRLLMGRAGIQIVARPLKHAWDDSWERPDRRTLTQISATLFTPTQAAVNCGWVHAIHHSESEAGYSTGGFSELASAANRGSWAAFATLNDDGGPNTMTHELGHVLGLPHLEDGPPTMIASLSPFPDDVSEWDEDVDGLNIMQARGAAISADVRWSRSQILRLRLSVVSGVVPYAAWSSSSSAVRPFARVSGAAVAGAVLE